MRFVRPNGKLLKSHKIAHCVNNASVDDEEARQFMRFVLDHLPNDARIDNRSKADILAKALTCLQALWFAVQTIARLKQRLGVSPLETLTVAYILLAVFAYSVWFSKPYNVEISDHVSLPTELDFIAATAGSKTYETAVFSFDLAFVDMDWSEDGWLATLTFGSFFAAFAGVHCAAWKYPFPTVVESYMWRVVAVLTDVMPLLTHLFIILTTDSENSDHLWIQWTGFCVCLFPLILYILGRLFVLIEVFISFRSAPQGIYQQLNWSNYFGHIGS